MLTLGAMTAAFPKPCPAKRAGQKCFSVRYLWRLFMPPRSWHNGTSRARSVAMCAAVYYRLPPALAPSRPHSPAAPHGSLLCTRRTSPDYSKPRPDPRVRGYHGLVVGSSGRDVRTCAPGLPEKVAAMMRGLCLVALVIGALTLVEGELSGGPSAEAATPSRAGAAQSYYPLPTQPVTRPPSAIVLPLLSPFPVVRIAGRITRRGARIRVLSVKAPASATIVVRCRRHGCSRRSTKQGRGMSRAVRFKRFERPFRAGTY